MSLLYLVPVVVLVVAGGAFLVNIERAVYNVPPEVLAATPKRFTDDDILSAASELQQHPTDVTPFLGARTGRRYIVVGGSGFVGGWIVLHLLARGEDPRRIRILDLRAPARPSVVAALGDGVEFYQTNIADPQSVDAAFTASWPEGESAVQHGLTIFHTASLIRFVERVKFLLPPIKKINVYGTQLVVDAAKRAGATAFVYTSSGSVGIQQAGWLSPWLTWPTKLVQYIRDSDPLPTSFFSNYAVTKAGAEDIVREADDPNGMRTIRLRPSNAVYGSGGDTLVDAYMHRQVNPTWTYKVVQNCIHVENCSIAHLCAETALLDRGSRSGGQAYYICDAGPPIAYGDLYKAVTLLTAGRVTFPYLHAGFVFALAYVLEAYHLLQNSALRFLPRLPGDMLLLQPATFMLVTVHLLFDDTTARRSVAEGGLGYKTPYTTLQGIILTALQHEDERRRGAPGRSGINFGMGDDNPARPAVAPARADSTTQLPTAGTIAN